MSPISLSILFLLFLASGVPNKSNYRGSTPANSVVKSFLGIPITDSVDFIRWKLTIQNSRYELKCDYGISQANTNGFERGGQSLELKGDYEKRGGTYYFLNGKKVLKAIELNPDLLHLLYEDNTLMKGNGGWSYTLNNAAPAGVSPVFIAGTSPDFKDSIAFEGRTPCAVPGIVAPGALCYKLKWYLVLYRDANSKNGGTFKVSGTRWRQEGSRTGNWKTITGKSGQTIYHLTRKDGQDFLFLSKLDKNILAFTDANERLLVGDADFSYTLNRRW